MSGSAAARLLAADPVAVAPRLLGCVVRSRGVAVRLTEVDGERTVVFELRCNPEDIGKVIGKNGKTVGAIRTLLSTAAAR